ncbi:hypothetical protein CYLTODRAFT_449880 [Cylindrobasidium torrendii FP15055 ss-10]|uniref:Uncharacterized protein n=1 Tax=Cylindrobasidium torrendii FP15055 ss-10 TaxID=1314674 RepID=A0A0D7BSE3_9AGAR|nr:hypothetical protein CYLTODRAFT_449880 [Cylindrobasidium torrendii FP15055 ss-10]
MDRLCDEVLQFIFDELDYPGHLSVVNKRIYTVSQDPYVRAHYFLYRHGPIQALYHALGRGKLLSERVLDILISSGALLSRYFAQVAFHHYFHARTHFIKTQWARSVPLPVFTHFLKIASEHYGDIPRGKQEDDGTIFSWFLQDSRLSESSRRVDWEDVRQIFEKYKFLPFSDRDPLMAQFPRALAVEPRLLPYAVANGFVMDASYRNFIFRQMFERAPDRTADSIVQNVSELCRLDPTMFVSCTVAAEVCMEAKDNASGYNALKALNASNKLVFDLRILIEDLLKLFYKTRSVANRGTQEVLRHLWKDFPSSHPIVRHVMLLMIFLPGDISVSVPTAQAEITRLKLGPVTKTDMKSLMISPWMEKFEGLVNYMRKEVISDQASRGLTSAEIFSLMDEVAVRCLEINCKGKMLKKMVDNFPSVREAIMSAIQHHRIYLDRGQYRLCRAWYLEGDDRDYFWDGEPKGSSTPIEGASRQCLGPISQESLTSVIRNDESSSSRSRRRTGDYPFLSTQFPTSADSSGTGRWVHQEFGPRNVVTSTFLTHAIVNDNGSILEEFLHDNSQRVPLTLDHFKLLARLQKAPSYIVFRYILNGGDFYASEADYLYSKGDIKRESVSAKLSPHPRPGPSNGTRKRPRRSAAASVRSYADMDVDEPEPTTRPWATKGSCVKETGTAKENDKEREKERKAEQLRIWIKHLKELLKVEHVAHTKAKAEEAETAAKEGTERTRVYKNEFYKSLETNVRAFKKLDDERRQNAQGLGDAHASEYEDDEDYLDTRTAKRRKVVS